MARICRECGKKITGSVIKHYEEEHFSMYLKNKTALETNPSVFAPSETNTAEVAAIRAHNVVRNYRRRLSQPANAPAQDSVAHDKVYLKRRKMIMLTLEEYPKTQPYRDKSKSFICSLCKKEHKSGMVIFQPSANIRLCYACYNPIKAEIPPKPKKMKTLYAGIPGLGKRH